MARTGTYYYFYYNPCDDFDVSTNNKGCQGVAVCQQYQYSAYGYNLDGVQFEYINGSLFAAYHNVPSPDGLLRSTYIELICDESIYGRFELVGEDSWLLYTFKLYSLRACPGKCQRYVSSCINVNTCTCADPRGEIPINLHALDSPTSPTQDQTSPSAAMYYTLVPLLPPLIVVTSLCV